MDAIHLALASTAKADYFCTCDDKLFRLLKRRANDPANTHPMKQPWWNHTPLQQLSPSQWESLCDGCGKCCLHKLEDEDDGEIYTTAVACELLDCATAQCQDYAHRQVRVPECMVLRPQDVRAYTWLPASCAYRLRAQSLPLPDWHPLVTLDRDSTRNQGHSVAGRCLSARHVAEDAYQEHVIDWY